MITKLKRGKRGVDVKDRHVCKTVSITPQNYKIIQEIGGGNFSEGVRLLLYVKTFNVVDAKRERNGN